jgi:lipopolysaccharide/colanic/teichoic acid biosynthesis glycosyltransferase
MSAQSRFISNKSYSYLRIKRFFDVLLSTMLLVALAPLLCLISILIKLDSPGSILFTQERMGCQPYRLGRATIWTVQPFRMIKFRSMYCGSDESLHKNHIQSYIDKSAQVSDHPRELKTPQDPRITRIGRMLRKTSLDELPQLWNVLIGDMSLIGPRPVPVYEFELYSAETQKRFEARQGITGLWQVRGRCQLSFEEQIALDIEYAQNQSLWLDLKILLLTIPAVLFGRGAE